MTLSEPDKDRVAEVWRRLSAAYRSGAPEEILREEWNRLLAPEEQRYAAEQLLSRYIGADR
jgi:hypothetical protein